MAAYRKTKGTRFTEWVDRYKQILGCKWDYITSEHRSHLWAAWHDGYESAEKAKREQRRKKE